ncbi:YdcF family protein [uncultured Marinobacter sp.]|uniref:YdcF family protein n=1 Tax=uncultured Marinobacter sp. TaxID=187379 RepID=UPI0030DA85DC
MLALIKLAILPPFLNILIMAAGLLMLRRRPWLGGSFLVMGLSLLYLLSIPSTSWLLARGLEDHRIPTTEQAAAAGAIVILGGGREYSAPHWGGDDLVSEATLARLAEGVRWHRKTGVPILVTGGLGQKDAGKSSEAELMAAMLEQAFGVEARWLEKRSRDTRENADFSSAILKAEGVTTILLVSHAAHVTRAIPEFVRNGVDVIPGPMGFVHSPEGGASLTLAPRAIYLQENTRLLHEQIGRVYYGLTR